MSAYPKVFIHFAIKKPRVGEFSYQYGNYRLPVARRHLVPTWLTATTQATTLPGPLFYWPALDEEDN